MTQATLATLVVVLSVALVIAIVIILIGIIRYARLTNQYTLALNEIDSTINHATKAIRSGFRAVKQEIRHSEELTAQKRKDIIDLIIDSEARCAAMIRDLSLQLQMQGIRVQHPSVTVQTSTGGGAANQAGDNHNEQR